MVAEAKATFKAPVPRHPGILVRSNPAHLTLASR
jgi:hypothetical protein